MATLTLTKPVPPQAMNEKAAFGPLNLNDYVKSTQGVINFKAGLKDGSALPDGLICTTDGHLTGIPVKGSAGNYEVMVMAEDGIEELQILFSLIIKPVMATETGYIDKLKSQVWEALEQQLPLPDLNEMYNAPLSIMDIYYLLERWGILTVWDAYNLDPPSEKHILTLENSSPHYQVYDRGSSIVGTPKDLFSHERTLADALQTARAMAREVFKRRWTVEMVGIEPMRRAFWVELQHLSKQHGYNVEVINYPETPRLIDLYNAEVRENYRRKYEQS